MNNPAVMENIQGEACHSVPKATPMNPPMKEARDEMKFIDSAWRMLSPEFNKTAKSPVGLKILKLKTILKPPTPIIGSTVYEKSLKESVCYHGRIYICSKLYEEEYSPFTRFNK